MIQLPKPVTFNVTDFGTITLGTLLHRGGRRLNGGQTGATKLARNSRNWPELDDSGSEIVEGPTIHYLGPRPP